MAARAAHAAGFAPAVHYAEPGVMVSAFSARRPIDAADVRGECRPHRRAAAALPRRDARPCLRRGLHVLGVPRHPRLCPHARGGRQPAAAAAAALSRAGRRAGGGAAAAADRVRPQRPAAGQLPRRRRAAVADRFRICRLQHRHVRSGRASPPMPACRPTRPTSLLDSLFRRSARMPACAQSHMAMQCASLLREAMWSMVSELHLDAPGADYVAYTAREPRAARGRARHLSARPTESSRHDPACQRPDRRHRRRHHRLFDGLSSGARPQGRRGAARAGQADLRLDLACGGPRRPAALVGLDHARAEILGRSLQAARSRDRSCHRLEDDRLPAARHQPGPLDRISSGWRRRRKASAWTCICCRRPR